MHFEEACRARSAVVVDVDFDAAVPVNVAGIDAGGGPEFRLFEDLVDGQSICAALDLENRLALADQRTRHADLTIAAEDEEGRLAAGHDEEPSAPGSLRAAAVAEVDHPGLIRRRRGKD